MSRVSLKANINLEGLAEGWTSDHYLKFAMLDTPAREAAQEKFKALDKEDDKGFIAVMTTALQDNFLEGQIHTDDVATVAADKNDIPDFPDELIVHAFEKISRSKFADPKASQS